MNGSFLPSSVCVYCGTGTSANAVYREAAAALGRLLAEAGVRLVYGGGSVGLMGVVSHACMQAGGTVLGIIPAHLSEKEGQSHEITELVVVDSMHTRKQKMVENADAFVALPGGFGTLDETFEILTWKYLGLHDKPVVLLNVAGFYDPLLATMRHMVDQGFTPPRHLDLFRTVSSVDQVLDALACQPEPSLSTQTDKM